MRKIEDAAYMIAIETLDAVEKVFFYRLTPEMKRDVALQASAPETLNRLLSLEPEECSPSLPSGSP